MWRNFALLSAVVICLLMLTLVWHVRHIITIKEIYATIPLKRYLMSKEQYNIKAGDVLYMGNSISPAQDLMIPYVYKHVAIIVEFNNKLYVADSSNKDIIGRKKTSLVSRMRGVDIYPLDERLKNSLGAVFICKLNKPLTEEKNNILKQTIVERLGEPYPSVPHLYMLFILKIPIKTTLYCHTLIHTCLLQMNLINDHNSNAHQIGNFITNISDYQLNDGYKYEPIRQLIYDYECNDEEF